jgi:hypothetical protein
MCWNKDVFCWNICGPWIWSLAVWGIFTYDSSEKFCPVRVVNRYWKLVMHPLTPFSIPLTSKIIHLLQTSWVVKNSFCNILCIQKYFSALSFVECNKITQTVMRCDRTWNWGRLQACTGTVSALGNHDYTLMGGLYGLRKAENPRN